MRHYLCVLVAVFLSIEGLAGVRKVRPVTEQLTDVIDPRASAGLFVGVRDFPDDETLIPVKYAVDDAVDLAFQLTIERQPPLIRPDRVVLALSGEPQKSESQQNLKALLAAGATRHTAGQTEILKLLQSQSRNVGTNGILIVAFATHGMSEDGTQYLLTSTSLLDYPETMLTEVKVCDVVSKNGVARSLILIDACRERLARGSRTGDTDRRSAAAVSSPVGSAEGQVVLSAAAAGDYAYDDNERGNGVFSAAVIDGLRCAAPTDEHGYVTCDTLAGFVEDRVLAWVRTNKNPAARKAIQIQSEGHAKSMPLVMCLRRSAAVSPPQRP